MRDFIFGSGFGVERGISSRGHVEPLKERLFGVRNCTATIVPLLEQRRAPVPSHVVIVHAKCA